MSERAAVRARNPRGQGERLREELLRATERLLEEVGSEDALSLRAVARAAGVAAPSIYRHFSDKTELVWATLEVSYERLAAAMAAAAAQAADDPVARLRAQLRAYCRYAVAHPATYRLLYETRQTPVDAERLAGHPAGLLVRSWQQALTACEDAGWRVRGSRSEAPYVLWSAVHGRVTLWQVMPSRKDTGRLDRFVDEMLQLLLER
ncbi:WHG domain-containing protein [Streptomyces platensis]|uniref:TetR/AcrR family transcriptional regulator n=1 Tax=Streptomyces platensis TaxID=58346 RepID=UPI0012E54A68|nr:TetR-like C-terminal domain-containing protein [Streptomyces platensis]WSI54279.1 WHG domain-containing protein [Streptomyces platensis]WTI55789.1 WHG domain-containing protein [Streptomyces platensis]WUB78682.1 WHG domain-containing protein [Streptomyces platensis]BCK67058.1 putative transcriptional regulator, TetR family protein [Streptomyces libani subsp. rufus]